MESSVSDIYEPHSDSDEDMYDGTGEAPDAEIISNSMNMPLTPESLPEEHQSNLTSILPQASLLSHIHSNQLSNSTLSSHSLASNRAVNGDIDEAGPNNSEATSLPNGVESEFVEAKEEPN